MIDKINQEIKSMTIEQVIAILDNYSVGDEYQRATEAAVLMLKEFKDLLGYAHE